MTAADAVQQTETQSVDGTPQPGFSAEAQPTPPANPHKPSRKKAASGKTAGRESRPKSRKDKVARIIPMFQGDPVAADAEKAQEKKMKIAELLSFLTMPAPTALPPAKPAYDVVLTAARGNNKDVGKGRGKEPEKVHPYDLYRLIGETAVVAFDPMKLVKRSNWDRLKEYFAAPKGDIKISPEYFNYDHNANAKPTPLKKVNTDEIPAVMSYEQEVTVAFAGRTAPQTAGQEDALLADTVMLVLQAHYGAPVRNKPTSMRNKFDFRGDGKIITGYNSEKMMNRIKENGVEVGYAENFEKHKTFVPRQLESGVPSMNQVDAFFIMAGFTFVERVKARLAPPAP